MSIEEQLEQKIINLPRVGKQAPYFKAECNGLTFSRDDFRGKWLVLFSQPAGFTPSDSGELVESIEIYPELKKRGVVVLALSVSSDASEMHRLVDLPEEIGATTPLVIKGAVSQEVALAYGRTWLVPGHTSGRCVYVIDDKQTVKAILYYPLPTKGRMREVLKILEGLRTTYASVVSPSIWKCNSYG
jgi:peroxiredoxin 2/4